MFVSDALKKRVSTRAFAEKPISEEKLKEIFSQIQRSPSNCNVQPWQTYVVSGEAKDKLKESLCAEVMTGKPPYPEFDWKIRYDGKHRDRQFGSAFTLYDALGIEREDKTGRMMAGLRNWQFFDAPHVVFFTMDRYLGIMGAVDLGIYAQSLALVLAENGLSSCMQGALGQYPGPVREQLGIPESQSILFGMSIGYALEDAPANKAITDRVDLTESVEFVY